MKLNGNVIQYLPSGINKVHLVSYSGSIKNANPDLTYSLIAGDL